MSNIKLSIFNVTQGTQFPIHHVFKVTDTFLLRSNYKANNIFSFWGF